ncbi:MAG: radical SAM protein [Candidatus Thorarchaeota archaeon]
MKKLVNSIIQKYKPWTLASYIGRLPFMTDLFQYIYYHYFSEPKSVKIHINSDCNYNCVYCYSSSKQKVLPTEKWLEFIDELKHYNIQTIEISGGEPFLHKDFIKILKRCIKDNYQITIYTNGSLINSKWVKKIKALNGKIIISIKYDCPETYGRNIKNKIRLKTIDKNIKLLTQNNIPVVAFITVTKNSVKYIKDTINRSIDIGAFPVVERYAPVKDDKINDKLMINSKDWSYVIKLIKKVYSNYSSVIDGVNRIQGSTCSCYTTQFSVMQNGDVLPCQFLPVSQSIGNIKKMGIEDIWQRIEKKRKKWLKLPKECKSCKNKLLCSGGCRTYSFYIHQNFSRKDPLCESNWPTTYGHCAFTVIHALNARNFNNSRLIRLK